MIYKLKKLSITPFNATLHSLPKLFKPYFEMQLLDKKIIRIYLEDVYPNSLIPFSKNIKIINQNCRHLIIPQSLKKDLWKFNFQNNNYGRCFICKKELSFSNFDIGYYENFNHTLDNLKILCSECKNIIGSKKILDFNY